MRISGNSRIAWLLSAIALISPFAAANSCQATVATMTPIYDPYRNAELYVVGSTSSTWSQDQTLAQALGGHLVTIHSAAENQFVTSQIFVNLASLGGPNLSNIPEISIGLTDPTGLAGTSETSTQHANNFVWVDGENSSYRNWSIFPAEPDNGNGGPHEYYSAMFGPGATQFTGGEPATTGTWNDTAEEYVGPFTSGVYGIAAVPVPEPASIGAIAMVCTMLLRPRKSGRV